MPAPMSSCRPARATSTRSWSTARSGCAAASSQGSTLNAPRRWSPPPASALWADRYGGSVWRAVLLRKDVLAVGTGLGVIVDVGIGDLVERCAVADDQKQHVLVGPVHEAMGVAATGGEARAHAGVQCLGAVVGLEHDLALNHP